MSIENALLPRVWELERSLGQAVRVNDVLRQQLADSQKQSIEDSENILRLIETIKYLQWIAVRGSGIDQSDDQTVEQFVLSYVKGLEKQLAAALAACKLKDESLRFIYDNAKDPFTAGRELQKALAIKPDDSALKAWLGEPEWFCRKDANGVNVFYEDIEERPAGCTPLYSPKGLK